MSVFIYAVYLFNFRALRAVFASGFCIINFFDVITFFNYDIIKLIMMQKLKPTKFEHVDRVIVNEKKALTFFCLCCM